MGLFDPTTHALKETKTSMWDGKTVFVAWCGYTEKAERTETKSFGGGRGLSGCGACRRKAQKAGAL